MIWRLLSGSRGKKKKKKKSLLLPGLSSSQPQKHVPMPHELQTVFVHSPTQCFKPFLLWTWLCSEKNNWWQNGSPPLQILCWMGDQMRREPIVGDTESYGGGSY